MAVTITLLDATRQIKPHAALLQHTIAAALDQIRAHVRLDNLDITVTPFQAGKASPSGIGGYALSPHRVELMIDCQRDDLATVIETELLDVLAHEVHHSLRLAHDLPTETLAQQLILEGLACHFESTVNRQRRQGLVALYRARRWRLAHHAGGYAARAE